MTEAVSREYPFNVDRIQRQIRGILRQANREIETSQPAIIGCWRCGADLSRLTYEQGFQHIDRCYGKGPEE